MGYFSDISFLNNSEKERGRSIGLAEEGYLPASITFRPEKVLQLYLFSHYKPLINTATSQSSHNDHLRGEDNTPQHVYHSQRYHFR